MYTLQWPIHRDTCEVFGDKISIRNVILALSANYVGVHTMKLFDNDGNEINIYEFSKQK